MPVSLSQGHIRTPEFKINLESTYYFEVEINPRFDPEGSPCFARRWCLSGLKTSWSLSNGERVIAHGKSEPGDWILGSFDVEKGRYVLDLDVLQDGSDLNAGAPHLVVLEPGGSGRAKVDEAMGRAFLLFLLLEAAGIFLIIRGLWERRAEKRAAWARAWSLTQPGPLPPLPDARPQATPAPARARPYSWTIDRNRHRKLWLPNVPAFSRLSWYSLLIVIAFELLVIPMWFIHGVTNPTPMGLVIHLVGTGIPTQSTPFMEPLVVHVEFGGRTGRPLLYLNSQPVAWEDLGAVVQKELNRRPPHWPVYVEGDPDLMWGSVGHAIDIIRGANGEVVLLGSATASPRLAH
ncbi:MAG: ExbD/TolR family protein [Bryobacteraceae bacterium]